MSETVSGLVFSTYALVVMISSPFMGYLIPHIGAKFLLISGVFCAGVSNILFGLLDQIESKTLFTFYCFVVRSFEAVGAAAFSTASYTYIMHSFPDDVGTAFGITETCVGLGMSLGPAVGAAFYTLGGYGLPFYVLGTFVLLNIPFLWLVIQPICTNEKKDVNQKPEVISEDGAKVGHQAVTKTAKRRKASKFTYGKLISIPEVAVVSLVVVVVSQSQGFLDPTVEPHFRQYGLGAQFVGFVFLIMSAAYAIFSPITGWIASKMENKFPLMIIGLFLSAVGLSLLGPSDFIPLDPAVWLTSFAMVIMGLAYAVAFIPTFESILDYAIDNGFPDEVKTYSLVSGLWSSMYSLGEVTGPLLGGAFVDYLDFPSAATIMAAFSIIAALIALATYMVEGGCSSDSTDSQSGSSSSISSSANHSSSSSTQEISSGITKKTIGAEIPIEHVISRNGTLKAPKAIESVVSNKSNIPPPHPILNRSSSKRKKELTESV